MRKLIRLGVIFTCVLTLCSCSEEGVDIHEKSWLGDDKGHYDILTEEQIAYLTEEQRYTKDRLELMSYEAINWELRGTGLELYNQSSGIEVYGLSYVEEEPIATVSDSDELITFEEVVTIRKKGNDLRLNDFAKYKYTLIDKADSKSLRYEMHIPIEGYKDTYVEIIYDYDEADSRVINMKVPFVRYDCKNGSDAAFSILYDREDIIQFFENEPKYTDKDKVYIGVAYSTVTENSLVLSVNNNSSKDCKLIYKYELYEITSGEEKLIASAEGDEYVLKSMWIYHEAIDFGEDVKLEKGKKYLIKFGKNEKNYFYDEVEFERE